MSFFNNFHFAGLKVNINGEFVVHQRLTQKCYNILFLKLSQLCRC